ncbi:hypothetical protein HY604_03345, partial [Candidatus Peregrinibacteria bacterium]|nr:hypothetical protein [Candidatus Peregrinibacteria bacterium]
ARLRAQLEKDLKDKNKVINEHYLEILKWPEDEKIIREIFERLVTYRYDTNKGGRYRDSKQLEAQPRVFLSDFHPFQLVYMAKAIGVPDDFQFTVYEDRPKQGYERLYRGKKYKSMTLGELIKYEKSRLLTDVVLDDDKKHEDDEWLLLLLNLEGVSDPSTVVGTNLDGKPIRKSDVVDSVKSELMISTKFGPQILNWDRRLFGTLYFHAEGNISVLQKTVRTIKNSPFTCYGIHAAEALLGDPSVSDGDKRKYVDEIFSIIFNKYLVVKTFSSSDDPRILSNNILVLGHSLEIYLEYKKYFSPEQQEVFKFMIAELAELMKSVSLSKKHTASYDAFLIHLVGVLRRLEE